MVSSFSVDMLSNGLDLLRIGQIRMLITNKVALFTREFNARIAM